MDVSIQEIDGRLMLVSPYNRDFPDAAKALGGRWDAKRKAWTFDPRDRDRLERLATRFFGYAAESSGETVDVRIHAERHYDEDGRLMFAGRIIARRRGRDLPVSLADNAVLVGGAFPDSGGSVRRPRIGLVSYGQAEPVVEIRDLPVEALTTEDAEGYEIVGGDPLRALREERDRLVDRLAEIDRELGKDGNHE